MVLLGMVAIVLGVIGVIAVRKMPRERRLRDGGVTSDGYCILMVILGGMIVIGAVFFAFGLAIAWGG